MRKTEKKKRIAPNAKNLVVGIIAILFFIFSVIILALGILGIIAGWNMLNSDIGIVNFFGSMFGHHVFSNNVDRYFMRVLEND